MTEVHCHIEQVTETVRKYIAEGKLDQVKSLAASLWGAFRHWERITRGDQQHGHALELENKIEKLEDEARKASTA
ncbi:hypothetical protein [Herbaspirillum rubrisubalbicans]|nr:hypothetical protein [Herbaspirillum rubrisubalbicans]